MGSLEAPMAAKVWFGRGLKLLRLIRFECDQPGFPGRTERNTGVLRSAQNDNFNSCAEQKTPKNTSSLTGCRVGVGADSGGLRGCRSDGLFGAALAGYEDADTFDHFGR